MAKYLRWSAALSLVVLVLIASGAVGLATARTATPQAQSRGVIILPGPGGAALARLQTGESSTLAGQRVTIAQSDAQIGLLVKSPTLADADLALALNDAGVQAEVNQPRFILPVTPTAELFNRPQSIRPADDPNTPDFWHVARLGADIVHQSGRQGDPSVIVGVIDTGVDLTHPLLKDVLLPGKNFVYTDSDANDTYGHGTHVAGIVHSICPKCRLLPVKVLDYYGGDDYTIARGILYARQQGAQVIQISLGGPAPSGTMCRAIKNVTADGAQVVIAAGNSAGSDTWSIGYPALCDPESLVVSATNRYDISSWFSNYGPAVDIAAPGEQVWSTVPTFLDGSGLYPASGTSMAAPMVSGAAALLWSANPEWTAAQIRGRLITAAREIGTLPGIDDTYGPRLDVAQAFGLISRPMVVGMEVDKPWVPQAGADAERTIHVSAHVRGDGVSAVRLAVTIAGTVDRKPMVKGSGDTYSLDYVVPAHTGLQRDITVQITATNSTGATSGLPEEVIQEGKPIAPPKITQLTANPHPWQAIWFKVEWDGTWEYFDFNCGNFYGYQYYVPKGQEVVCYYPTTGSYRASAVLWSNFMPKTTATAPVEVPPAPPIYLPLIHRPAKL
jgi:hypothetical protein